MNPTKVTPTPTNDRERISLALALLAGAGFETRDASEDCSTCALAAIPDATERFAYVHEQDVDERAIDANGNLISPVYVGYGTTARHGTMVVEALEAAGLITEWTGSPGERIAVVARIERVDR